jgi:muramoyltetrapeptide carboxypeptidase
MKIGIVAVSSRFARDRGEAIQAWFDTRFPDRDVIVAFHPNSFDKSGHFAGDDAARADAFVEFFRPKRTPLLKKKVKRPNKQEILKDAS